MSLVDLGKRLLDATKRGDTEEVRQLMSNGAPFTTDWLGTSPLHFAAQFGHVSTAEVLLRAGISRDARTKVDRTPLHVASQEGHIEIVELLLRNGADIEAKDMLKMTPLHWAVEKGHVAVIQALIKQGADVTCDNKFDKTPVEISLTNGRTDIAHMLQMNQAGNIELTTAEPQVIEEVTTTPAIINNSLQHVVMAASPVAVIPNIHNQVLTTEAVGEVTDQSSTSVLATLAALAEASGPLNASSNTNTTAAEAWTWLETHGITMISSNDAPGMVASSLDSSQTLTLTEAGKLALNLVKQQTLVEDGGETEVVEETVETLDNVVTDGEQRVIAIVEDQGQMGDGTATVMVTVADGDSEDKEGLEEGTGEPLTKRARIEINQEELQRQLEEVQRKADEYKAQLKEKAQEAEVYRKQLNEMTGKSTSP